MKRNIAIMTALAVILSLVMFVKPAQTLALDFLSIFRVSNVEIIKITMADIQEGMQNIASLKEKFHTEKQDNNIEGFNKENFQHKSVINIVSKPEHDLRKLTDVDEFDAFRFRLPKELQSETPELSAITSGDTSFTIDVDVANKLLQTLNSPNQLSDNVRNVELKMVAADTAYAKYDDVVFMATQKSFLDAPEAVKSELHNVMINLPLIPTNVRHQLAEIELDSSNIYLPVLVGFGREVDLGGKSGYIYTVGDFKALKETMSQTVEMSVANNKSTDLFAAESHDAALEELREKFISKHGEQEYEAMKEKHQSMIADMPNIDDASILIWTKDGILYSLIGNKTDTELAKIAGSVR